MYLLWLLFTLIYLPARCRGAWGDPDWIKSVDGDVEYFIQGDSIMSRTWRSARDVCLGHGGDLADGTRRHDWGVIIKEMMHMYSLEIYWIGVSRLNTGEWQVSEDERIVSGNESYWDETDRDNVYPTGDILYGCAYINTDTRGRWRNQKCSARGGYVCQRPVSKEAHTTKSLPTTTLMAGTCPVGWFGISNRCYKVVRNETKSWTAALEHCSMAGGGGGSLASFHSEAENAVITAQLHQDDEAHYSLWVGFYEGADGVNWVWSDNSVTDFRNWDVSLSGGKCAALHSHTSGAWFKDKCVERKGYVCQVYKDGTEAATPPSSSACVDDFHYYDEACYTLVVNKWSTWQKAETMCRWLSSSSDTLVSIHSSAENAAMLVYMAYMGVNSSWIGMVKQADEEYTWSDGAAVTYTNWDNRHQESCAYLTPTGRWSSKSCIDSGSVEAAICKIPLRPLPTHPAPTTGVCPRSDGHPWQEYGDNCYQLWPKSMAWPDAIKTCAKSHHGATLVSIHSKVVNSFIYDLYKSAKIDSYENLWLGLYSSVGETFHWSDGSQIQYQPWARGEPSIKNSGKATCVAMNVRDIKEYNLRRWVTNDCERASTFVCQMGKSPPLPTPSDVPGYCNDDRWVARGAHCYLFVPDVFVTWEKARVTCRQDDAELAWVDDRAENEFIAEEMFELQKLPVDKSYWLGLRRTFPGYPFVWVASSLEPGADARFWKTHEKIEADQHCVRATTDHGTWYADECWEPHGYVCKVKKTNYPITPSILPSPDGHKDDNMPVFSLKMTLLIVSTFVLVPVIIAATVILYVFRVKIGQIWRKKFSEIKLVEKGGAVEFLEDAPDVEQEVAEGAASDA